MFSILKVCEFSPSLRRRKHTVKSLLHLPDSVKQCTNFKVLKSRGLQTEHRFIRLLNYVQVSVKLLSKLYAMGYAFVD